MRRGQLPASRFTYVWRNGGAGGSSSLGLVPEKQVAVVVLAKPGRGEGESALDELGISLLDESMGAR